MAHKYKVGDIVRFRNTLYSSYNDHLGEITAVYDNNDGFLDYGLRFLIPVGILKEKKLDTSYPMYVHEHELHDK